MGQIKIKKIRLSNKKMTSRIILISDVHYFSKKDLNKLNKILEKIKNLSPDYICILGDICDQARILDEELLISWLKTLASISKVIVVYGNHDLAQYKTHTSFFNKKLFDKIKNINNLSLLDNELKIENKLCFIGLKFGFDYYYKHNEKSEQFIKQYNKVVKKLDSNNYNILLTHSPIAVTRDGVVNKLNDYKNIDLVLCGHMHGGLMPNILRPIFKTQGLVSPNKHHLLVKNAYGSFKIKNINFMISSGITKLSHVNKLNVFDKLFSREIVLIDINKDNFDNKNIKVIK